MHRMCRPSSVWLRRVIEDLEIRCAGAEVARRQHGAGVRPDAFEQCWAVGSPSKSSQRRENVHPNSRLPRVSIAPRFTLTRGYASKGAAIVQFRRSKKVGPFRITISWNGIASGRGLSGNGADGKVRRTIRISGTGIYDARVVSPFRQKAATKSISSARSDPRHLLDGLIAAVSVEPPGDQRGKPRLVVIEGID